MKPNAKNVKARILTGCGVVLLAMQISGCNTKAGPCAQPGVEGVARYERCLAPHETIKRVTEPAPFTLLHIEYFKPGSWGSFSPGLTLEYVRILRDGLVVVEQAQQVERWEGLERTVLLATAKRPENAGLLLLDSAPNAPIVRHVPTGYNPWEVDTGFQLGYPWGRGRRYLPRRYNSNDGGMLLSLDPFRLELLPESPRSMLAPTVTTLASVSPDGRTYAYASSRTTPAAIMVVSASGDRRDPVALPITGLAPEAPGTSPYEPLRSWFAAAYTWQADSAGAWDLVPRRRPPQGIGTTEALEELFTDAANGYLQCFAAGNPHCMQKWNRLRDPAVLTGSCCESPYTYAPAEPVKAFGARVVALSLRRLIDGNSGYAMLAEGDAATLAAALEQRLRQRNIPFVRADRCPDLADSQEACERRLLDTINWQNPPDDNTLLRRILDEAEEKRPVFLTPTLAFGLYQDERGLTLLLPFARYVMSRAPRHGTRVPQSGAAPLHHKG